LYSDHAICDHPTEKELPSRTHTIAVTLW
jgi:hypothetical protein